LDELNPRSILHQVRLTKEHIESLPQREAGQRVPPLMRKVLQLETELATASASEMGGLELGALAINTAELSDLLGQTYLR
jgi:uncharacterized alpha-E superfamily protein